MKRSDRVAKDRSQAQRLSSDIENAAKDAETFADAIADRSRQIRALALTLIDDEKVAAERAPNQASAARVELDKLVRLATDRASAVAARIQSA